MSDPCYDLKDVNSKKEINYKFKAKPGTWVYDFNEETKTLDVYELNGSFLVTDEGINSNIFDDILYFGVDSGQVGVFLENAYRNDRLLKNVEFFDEYFESLSSEPWYRACAEVTSSLGDMGFVPGGFVTGTKYGDGVYPVGVKYVKGTKEVAYIRIITDDICDYCGKEDCDCECERCSYCNEKESNCECEYCNNCGEHCYECSCEYCDECEELIDNCTCTEAE